MGPLEMNPELQIKCSARQCVSSADSNKVRSVWTRDKGADAPPRYQLCEHCYEQYSQRTRSFDFQRWMVLNLTQYPPLKIAQNLLELEKDLLSIFPNEVERQFDSLSDNLSGASESATPEAV